MNSISEMLGVGLVLWIAWHIAQRIAPTQGVARTCSNRVAGATFFIVLLFSWFKSPLQEFVDVLAILARAALAGGGVLVVGWLALPILLATWQNLRPLIICAATWPADVVRGPRRRREQAAQAVAQAAAARQTAIDRERRAHAEAIAAEQLLKFNAGARTPEWNVICSTGFIPQRLTNGSHAQNAINSLRNTCETTCHPAKSKSEGRSFAKSFNDIVTRFTLPRNSNRSVIWQTGFRSKRRRPSS